jgi:hypothetical protein
LSTHDDIAAAITLNVQLGERRTLSLATYVPRDADIGAYNAVLDKLGAAADRQEAKIKLIDLKRELQVTTARAEQHASDYQRIDQKNADDWERSGKKGAPRLSAQEQSAKDNAKIAAENYRKQIDALVAEIAATEGIINA